MGQLHEAIALQKRARLRAKGLQLLWFEVVLLYLDVTACWEVLTEPFFGLRDQELLLQHLDIHKAVVLVKLSDDPLLVGREPIRDVVGTLAFALEPAFGDQLKHSLLDVPVLYAGCLDEGVEGERTAKSRQKPKYFRLLEQSVLLGDELISD